MYCNFVYMFQTSNIENLKFGILGGKKKTS
uniref:Uncharacterized protein n=1 Tax=Arundo donax TaxID=35708 RepID=A0A0A9AL39_ARUDO